MFVFILLVKAAILFLVVRWLFAREASSADKLREKQIERDVEAEYRRQSYGPEVQRRVQERLLKDEQR